MNVAWLPFFGKVFIYNGSTIEYFYILIKSTRATIPDINTARHQVGIHRWCACVCVCCAVFFFILINGYWISKSGSVKASKRRSKHKAAISTFNFVDGLQEYKFFCRRCVDVVWAAFNLSHTHTHTSSQCCLTRYVRGRTQWNNKTPLNKPLGTKNSPKYHSLR